MLLTPLLLACTTADPSWSTDALFGAAEGSVPAEATEVSDAPADPRFPTDEALAALEDPWQLEDPVTVEVGDAPVADAGPDEPEAVVTQAEVASEPEAAPVVDAPPAQGLPSAPAWGVRLLSTLPGAVPPRAAIGLPSGEEIVVSPGSMLPEVGMVVIAVGADTAQLAKITANGDHAVIETTTLSAQYPRRSED